MNTKMIKCQSAGNNEPIKKIIKCIYWIGNFDQLVSIIKQIMIDICFYIAADLNNE